MSTYESLPSPGTMLIRFAFLTCALLAFLPACSDSPASSEDSGLTDNSDLSGIPDSDSDVASEDVPDADAECTTLGCPCDDEDDCRSGYCVRSPLVGRVCADFCAGDCPEEGWECRLLENSGGDAVELCVPLGIAYCTECLADTDCGGVEGLCLQQIEGRFCAPPCDLDNPICPAGASCNPAPIDGVSYGVCTPDSGLCSPCIDDDGDQRGQGDACLGSDCNDDDDTSYAGAPEFCDGEDNDCDLELDEDFDLGTDADNCGECGVVCSDNNAISSCDAGVCVVDECVDGFANCDEDASNGCEVNEAAADACEACNDGVVVGGSCGACDLGTWSCVGVDAICTGGDTPENACGGCAELTSAPDDRCGSCGSGVWTCAADAESVVCTGDVGDGALNACGGCGVIEGPPGAECGACGGVWQCEDDDASVACIGDPTDSDSDGVCDVDDRCEGFPDSADADGDGTPDGCEDECPDGFFGPTCLGECECASGDCDDGLTGTGVCECADGFIGARCDRCDDGLFGADCAGVCDCINGSCDDGVDGDGACTCAAGFDGIRCDACETGRYGATCTGVCACVNGDCADGIGGDGACTCDDGARGLLCDECDPNFFGSDCAPCRRCRLGFECDDGAEGTGFCVSDCIPTGSPDTNCDAIDDDCNGIADDGFVPPAGFCGCLDCGTDGSGRELFYPESETSWVCQRGDVVCVPDAGSECIRGCE